MKKIAWCLVMLVFWALPVRAQFVLIDSIQGPHLNDGFGAAMAGLRDVNGDSVPDFIVSAPSYPGYNPVYGAVLLFSGQDLTIIDTVKTELGSTSFGKAVAPIADGFDFYTYVEFVVGDKFSSLYQGEAHGFSSSLVQTMWFYGDSTGDEFGTAMVSPGDLDHDGAPDWIIGAPGARRYDMDELGYARIYYSSPISPLTVSIGNNYDRFGQSVDGGPDLNGDGTPDWIVGAPCFWGTDEGYPDPGHVYAMDGNSGFEQLYVVTGEQNNDHFGEKVVFVGDVNGDTVSDFLVTANLANPNGKTKAGRVYLVDGKYGTIMAVFDGEVPFQYFGDDIAAAGDINLDGTPDFLISCPNCSPHGSVFLYSGATRTVLHRFDGTRSLAGFGKNIATINDINDDGRREILIQEVRYDTAFPWPTDSWVYVYSWDNIPPVVTVLGPNGGETFAPSDTVSVTWIATDNDVVDSVNIYYSIDDGATWRVISHGEQNDSSYRWVVPDSQTVQGRIRVTAYDHVGLWGNDTSDSAFAIVSPSMFAPAKYSGTGTDPAYVFSTDLDLDGDMDIVSANYNGANVSILKNDGTGSFPAHVDYAVETNPAGVFCADLDGDGDADLVVTNYGSNSISVLKNNGNGTFQPSVNYSAGSGPFAPFCVDIDGDDDVDILVPNANDDNISILKNNGNGIFQPRVNYAVGDGPLSLFAADFDQDGDNDIAVANEWSGGISILKNNGDGTLQGAVSYPTGTKQRYCFSSDIDGDSDLDIVVADVREYPGKLYVLENNGNATFQSAVAYSLNNEPVGSFLADLDGDGDMDAAVSNAYSDNVSVLKNNGDGTFQAKEDFTVGDGPHGIFCTDIDADGDFDVIASGAFSGNAIAILENLTQLHANSAPAPFNLLLPSNASNASGIISFDWQTPYDPNLGDQIRYDLYVSTSSTFHPDSTEEIDSIAVSHHTDTLEAAANYYWKVHAYDNWSNGRWSSQIWQFSMCASKPGDANNSNSVNLSDIIFIVNKVFKSGPAPFYACATNANGDGTLANLTDIIYLVNYVFKGGPAPIKSGVCCL